MSFCISSFILIDFLLSSAVKLQSTMQQMEHNGQEANEELQAKALTIGLTTIWKVGKLEIESVVRSVCEAVMQDQGVDKHTLKRRSQGVLELAKIYEKV